MHCNHDKYKINFHKCYEKKKLVCLHGFCIHYQYWGSHFPKYSSIYHQLQQKLISNNHFISGKSLAGIFQLQFVWVVAIMKASVQPWKTSKVSFFLFSPWLFGSSIRCMFHRPTRNLVFPQRHTVTLMNQIHIFKSKSKNVYYNNLELLLIIRLI